MLSYIQTRKPDGTQGITVVLGHKTHFIPDSAEGYASVLEALKPGSGLGEADILAMVTETVARLQKAIASSKLTDSVSIDNGVVLYNGEPVGAFITERMLQMLSDGFDLRPMARFLENLMENPSHRVVEQLYPFLEQGGIPLTPDGCFLTYKAVREDYRDIYSGKFDNHIGCTPTMPRNRVDENPDQTCSAGLHVCSFDYLPNFSHANGHVMVCKVNPRDVVAVPRDYNNTKMRVCRYEVVDEYADYYKEHPECAWKESVVSDYDDPDFEADDEVNDEVDAEFDEYGLSVYRTEDELIAGTPSEVRGGYDALDELKVAAVDIKQPYYRVVAWRNDRSDVVFILAGSAYQAR